MNVFYENHQKLCSRTSGLGCENPSGVTGLPLEPTAPMRLLNSGDSQTHDVPKVPKIRHFDLTVGEQSYHLDQINP